MNNHHTRTPTGPTVSTTAGIPTAVRRGRGLRLLGWTLLAGSVGLVSCQSLFVL